MKDLLITYEETSPEIIFEWNDTETEAKGWLVINSLRGGAAGGGTRMRQGLDKAEVISLAKTMEIKFTIAGPAIGGAKSGINFDPADPRKEEVLQRWFKAVTPILKAYYGTGGDLNIDEIHEVIPITASFGLWHTQEGVLNGHLNPQEGDKIHYLNRLREGVSLAVKHPSFAPDPESPTLIADLITGYGVSAAVAHYYHLWGGKLEGKRAIIQGWGNVGSAAGYYLSQAGVKIIGILDQYGALIKNEGFSQKEVRYMTMNRRNIWKTLNKDIIPYGTAMESFWSLGGEIFIPAAGSRMVGKEQVKTMIHHGLEVISSGANVAFDDNEIFYGDTLKYADSHIALIPDFIANSGMARLFAYLMEKEKEVQDKKIFEDVSNTIFNALKTVNNLSSEKTAITSKALQVALQQLIKEEKQLVH